MQEASSGQLVSGGAGGRLLVSESRHRIAKKFLVILSRPFLVPFLVPAFTGTRILCFHDIHGMVLGVRYTERSL